jgi:hypothetical protein
LRVQTEIWLCQPFANLEKYEQDLTTEGAPIPPALAVGGPQSALSRRLNIAPSKQLMGSLVGLLTLGSDDKNRRASDSLNLGKFYHGLVEVFVCAASIIFRTAKV